MKRRWCVHSELMDRFLMTLTMRMLYLFLLTMAAAQGGPLEPSRSVTCSATDPGEGPSDMDHPWEQVSKREVPCSMLQIRTRNRCRCCCCCAAVALTTNLSTLEPRVQTMITICWYPSERDHGWGPGPSNFALMGAFGPMSEAWRPPLKWATNRAFVREGRPPLSPTLPRGP